MSKIYLAEKTKQAIDAAIALDGGAKYREYLGLVLPHLKDAYDSTDERFRTHLGASLIGGDCPRALWYGFRWFKKPSFEGRILRLFNRGHLEEGRIIAALLCAGIPVYQQDEHGNQFRISDVNGHFGGSTDGLLFNIPDLPGQTVLGEFKTHSEKSFNELLKQGVQSAKKEHYIQMQCYMHKLGVAAGLYIAVNKNNDEFYMELVALDSTIAGVYIQRAESIISSRTPPDRISNTSSYYKCRFCDFKNICFIVAKPEKNCRTCEYSIPIENKQWACEFKSALEIDYYILSKEEQLVGCDEYSDITQKNY